MRPPHLDHVGVFGAQALQRAAKLSRRRKHMILRRDQRRNVRTSPQLRVKQRDFASGCIARAERRRKELEEKGQPADFATVLADIQQRDYQDTHRAIAPLKQADDAILVDTSSIGFDESFELLKRTILAHI